jgi:hypothetical protein
MTLTLKEIGRGGVASLLHRHPIIAIPPNDLDMYATSTAIITFTTDVTVPGRTAVVFPGNGGANVTVQVTTGANFDAGKTLFVTVTGRNEFFDEVTETISCVGNGSATQTFQGSTLFSFVRTITCRVNTVVTAGPLVTVGCGDGQAAPATLIIPNPFPFIAPSKMLILISGTAPTAGLAVTGANANGLGGFRGLRVGAGYTATNLMRFARLVCQDVSFDEIELT